MPWRAVFNVQLLFPPSIGRCRMVSKSLLPYDWQPFVWWSWTSPKFCMDSLRDFFYTSNGMCYPERTNKMLNSCRIVLLYEGKFPLFSGRLRKRNSKATAGGRIWKGRMQRRTGINHHKWRGGVWDTGWDKVILRFFPFKFLFVVWLLLYLLNNIFVPF